MRWVLLFAALWAIPFWRAASAEAPQFSDVYVSGREGYDTFRIPAAVTTNAGTILAFAEGRISRDDHAQNDIVLKRSSDNGVTWGPVELVKEAGSDSLNNPCAVVLRDSGRILLMFQHYPEGTGGEKGATPGYKADSICSGYIMTSDDDGKTWSPWRDITRSVKRPDYVTTIASGPNNGIELRRGDHKGRIVFPFNQGPLNDWKVYAVFSDDGGATWAYGEVAPSTDETIANEVQMIECADGSVRLNARAKGDLKRRLTAVSSDGGESWSPLEPVTDLPEPHCNASMVRITDPLDGEVNLVAYTGPVTEKGRNTGTICISDDDGATWPTQRVFVPGRFAYSSITPTADGMIGVLYETGESDPYERIRFARIDANWVRAGE